MAKWLMKAEPDPRIVKGKDVKFSVDDFEKIGVSSWEGVRNFEARNIMRDKMKLGDKVLFYHSSCKSPGITALAEVSKESYPDYTAWDPKHPYFDAKSDPESPKWYMVDVKFNRRLPFLVSLVVLRALASLSAPPSYLPYLTENHLAGIKSMNLLNRGRLSVQPVEDVAWEAIELLGEKGGWEGHLDVKGSKKTVGKKGSDSREGGAENHSMDNEAVRRTKESKNTGGQKRKRIIEGEEESGRTVRRSTRRKQGI
ncbi:hypothetical protein BOTBODRAFT_131112 [Botryobasidium botryosum FD-172 SS1]|uniref:EVE domain-containing protein n=1 Tax=Botryobasidium botryosum (strain FD-172 SS1) TaxID=930990 RepID=A0A067MHX9_BOTB1|nr:hypothetical protein BOTBODRAFT_131112 [Botryobasidium botryosum FD-172 SS1]